jgi:hypothetical protein
MVPVAVGTQELLTFCTPGGRQFIFIVMITDVAILDHSHCQPMRPILEVTENAKSSTAIAHIERDLKYIDAAFEKMKSDITNNISDIFTKDSNSDEKSSFSSKMS